MSNRMPLQRPRSTTSESKNNNNMLLQVKIISLMIHWELHNLSFLLFYFSFSTTSRTMMSRVVSSTVSSWSDFKTPSKTTTRRWTTMPIWTTRRWRSSFAFKAAAARWRTTTGSELATSQMTRAQELQNARPNCRRKTKCLRRCSHVQVDQSARRIFKCPRWEWCLTFRHRSNVRSRVCLRR